MGTGLLLHASFQERGLMGALYTWFPGLPWVTTPCQDIAEESMEEACSFLVHFSLKDIQLVPLIIPLARANHKGVWEM